MRRLGFASALVAAACASESVQDPTAATYHGQVRAILEANCVGCHTSDGIGPFALDSYESAFATAAIAVDAVEDHRMPPFPPAPGCRDYEGERRLVADDIAMMRAWFDGGRIEGDPASYIAPVPQNLELQLGEPTVRLTPEAAYAPNPERPDDYRCFPLKHTFDEEAYLVRAIVEPDQRSLVHHVIIYMVESHFADAVTTLDEADPDPGYACFGGVGVGSPKLVGAWVPGARPVRATDEAALRIPKGAKLIMQMHYNVLASDPQPDQSELKLWFLDKRPEFLVNVMPFPNFGIDIDPGDSASTHTRVFTNNTGATWTAVGASAHMHLIGSKIRLDATHVDGREECVYNIPNWDFGWQGGYTFARGQEIEIEPGAQLELTCTYDNSAENQPVINGARRTPERVQWGEGTLDEMCLAYLTVIEPYTELPDVTNLCAGFQGCYDACRLNGAYGIPTVCALQCSSRSPAQCGNCVIPGLIQCGVDACPTTTAGLVECLQDCQGDANPNACVTNTCVPHIYAFDHCISPMIANGECQKGVVGCGIKL